MDTFELYLSDGSKVYNTDKADELIEFDDSLTITGYYIYSGLMMKWLPVEIPKDPKLKEIWNKRIDGLRDHMLDEIALFRDDFLNTQESEDSRMMFKAIFSYK